MADRSWQKVEEWMTLYGDRIIRIVYLIIDDYHLAEEITQEVFVRAYQSLDSFRGESSAYTWLYRIALNLSKNYLQRKARIRFLPWNPEEEKNILEESNDGLTESLEDKVIKLTLGKKIRDCIQELPLIYREVIILYYFAELKISEIARVVQQPEGTVKSKLSRGRERLENIMRKEGLEYEGER